MENRTVMEGLKVRFARYRLLEGNPFEPLEELSEIPANARSHPRYRSAVSLDFRPQVRRRAETIAAAKPGDPQATQYLRYCERKLNASQEAARARLEGQGEAAARACLTVGHGLRPAHDLGSGKQAEGVGLLDLHGP